MIVIDGSRSRLLASLQDVWQYRSLLSRLVLRDVVVRYKQTRLGLAWAVLQPLTSLLIYSVVFGRLARLPSGGVPYPLFCFAALIVWNLLAGIISGASGSLIANATLFTKVYFPRLLLPLSSIGTGLIDFVIALGLFFLMLTLYGVAPSWRMLALPLLAIPVLLIAVGVGLVLAAMSVAYRDVRHSIAFLIQIWFYACPITYPSSLVPRRWQAMYSLNPMVPILDAARWALLGEQCPDVWTLVRGTVVAMAVAAAGLWYFMRAESRFADVV